MVKMFDWITGFIDSAGYLGIVFLMLVENVFPPIPSELIMPLAGYAAARGELNLILVIVSGTIGSIVGALIWYGVGRWLGLDHLRRFADSHGRWLTLTPQELDQAQKFFSRHCGKAVLLGRVIPAVRSLISIPAGIVGMTPVKFLIYSALGSAVWTAALAIAGALLESHYSEISDWLNPVSNVIVGFTVIWYLYRVATFGRNSANMHN
jgi:membrane protein DedA with SNARE-associated domain